MDSPVLGKIIRFQRAARNVSLRRGRPVSGGGLGPRPSSSPPPAQRPTSLSAAPAAASAHPPSAPSPHRPRRHTAPPNHSNSSSSSSHSSCRQILTAGSPVLRELAAADFPIRGRHGGQVLLPPPLPPAQLGLAALRQPPAAGRGLFTFPSENRKQHRPPLPILLLRRHGRRAMNRLGRRAGSPWRPVATHRRRR